MPSIASPVTLPHSGKTAPTATLKSAMTERIGVWNRDQPEKRGEVTPEYIKLYEEWGKGKIGVIVLGNLPIDYDGLEAIGNVIIDPRSSFDPVEGLSKAIKAAKAHGSLCIGQLTHGGRQTSLEVVETPVSSSDIQCPPMGGMQFGRPRPLTIEEIKELVQRWAYGAEVLYRAGADGAQLHGAHGYLLSQFLSARTNKRTDAYGGSFENRSRIVFEALDEMKKRVPKDFILSMKLNSADFSEGGMTPEESKELCIKLDEAGLDIIELSGGTYETMGSAFSHKSESTKKREAYFIEFADNIRPALKTAKLCVTGGFRSKKGMDEALETSVDFVGLARPLTAEPYLIKEMIEGKKDAARENKVNPALQTGAAVAQIGALSHHGVDAIPDFSSEEEAKKIEEALMGKKRENKPVENQETGSYEKSTA
ncbi:hypothetical protein JCM10212_002077 [Sporobolomyces blumeae]